jgi:hypothetical protein
MFSIISVLIIVILSLQFINTIDAKQPVMATTSTSSTVYVEVCDTRINNCGGLQDYSGVTVISVLMCFILVFACVYCIIIEPRDFEYDLKRNNNKERQ